MKRSFISEWKRNLSLTSLITHSFPVTLPSQDLDLTCNRLNEIEQCVLNLPGLTSLSFRQNLLSDASAITELKSRTGLQQLIFHDNHLNQIPSLGSFASLARLELSYNEFRSLQPLEELASVPLVELFAANNKITSCDGLASLSQLQVLELGSNRIKKIEQLEGKDQLRQIWLGKNRIESLIGFPTLLNLTILALPNNRLTSMKGVESCVNLEELYLSFNGIQQIEGLDTLARLKILDLAANMIERVTGLEHLKELTDLWLNDNKIASFDGMQEALASQRQSLTCIYLENNPLHTRSPLYRATVLEMFPNLQQLDSNDVVR